MQLELRFNQITSVSDNAQQIKEVLEKKQRKRLIWF